MRRESDRSLFDNRLVLELRARLKYFLKSIVSLDTRPSLLVLDEADAELLRSLPNNFLQCLTAEHNPVSNFLISHCNSSSINSFN